MAKKTSKIDTANVEFYEGGSLARVQRDKIKTSNKPIGGGRGIVNTFSHASRRRLMRFMASLRQDAAALFITLTYPDEFPSNYKKWKRDLKVFAERLKREFENAAFIWRLELQTRKSGKNKGEIAPHYHLILYGIDYTLKEDLQSFREWLSKIWYEVVASNDIRHFDTGTGCIPIDSHRGIMIYASKYLGKVEQIASLNVGRYWGAYFRRSLPLAEPIVVELTDKQAVKIIRWFRRHSGVRSRAYKSLTVFLDASQWRRQIQRMIDEKTI